MTSQIKTLLVVVAVFATVLVLVTGTAIAHPETPNARVDGDSSGIRSPQTDEWMGPDSWDHMNPWMNQFHWPEFSGRMFPQMDGSGFCHDGDQPGYGSMWGWGARSQMGRGFLNSGPGNSYEDQADQEFFGGMPDRGFGR